MRTVAGLLVIRTRVWQPAVGGAGIEVPGSRRSARFYDLRGVHAFWLLAGGVDLKVVMDGWDIAKSPPTRSTSARFPTLETRRSRRSSRYAAAWLTSER